MRLRRHAWILLVIALAIAGWQFWQRPSNVAADATGTSTEDRSVFYRLVSRYEHKGELVGFDIVIGCAVRITRYGDGDRSYDAFRDPTVYAKATKDGGAVWQIVPHACQGETTENGDVPKDFLPGAIWFNDKDDFSFGVAYVTEDAYENPKSELKFLGATIHRATRAEWEAFQPVAAQNLIEPRAFTQLLPSPPESEIKANLWNKAKLYQWWLPYFRCYGVERYELTSEAARAFVRGLWPASHPDYWMPSREGYGAFLSNPEVKGPTAINGHRWKDIAHLGYKQAQGYPTRDRGGMLRSGKAWSQLPPTIFPMKAEEGIPWVSAEVASAQTIYRDIETSELSKGVAYCYSLLVGVGATGKLHIPDYFSKHFLTRVDGQLISGEATDDTPPLQRPRSFFQNDQYYYRRFDFGLN